ncbi:ethanolamine ammonia-lyase subunit EutC [Nocardia sp. NPDC051463]|uniref:ethanolamine ammonia-lyase subunit EutC n=1 Tax=Nocardia sp. NPDC051463 TaxID=3154845 RepID=UPI003418F67C
MSGDSSAADVVVLSEFAARTGTAGHRQSTTVEGQPANAVPDADRPVAGSVASSAIGSDYAAEQRFWQELRRTTQARIGLGRTGDALPTGRVLEFRAAHAAARDAVHMPLDVAELAEQLTALGLGDIAHVHSRARDRAEYLRRPDLGRVPATTSAGEPAMSQVPRSGAEVGFILADGLSPRALTDHGPAMVAALVKELAPRYSIAAPVIATQARVALGDHIAESMGVATVVVLIGERPGLSVADSLGIYLTHQPRPGRTDADRNCISNIHPPAGLGYAQAAKVLAGLVSGARMLGRSGVDLKDASRTDAVGPGEFTSVEAGR